MSQIKEAIELVKKVKSDLWDYTSPNVNVKNEKLSEDIELLDQALTKLRTEQPPAGDFREIVNNRFPVFLPDSYEGMKSLCAELTDTVNEACDRLDHSEASRKELLTALKRISDIEDKRYTHGGFDLEINNISKAAIAKEKEVKK